MNNRSRILFITIVFCFSIIGCRSDSVSNSLDDELRELLQNAGISYTSLAPEPPINEAELKLGQALFFDKELSGNRDISCATCHHPLMHTGDGLSLPIGVGGHGLGAARVMGDGREFVARNSPEVFNRGAPEWVTMFWDGRISGSPEMGYSNPAGSMLPGGLRSVLAVQAMFPVTSLDEMRGKPSDASLTDGSNELADIPADDPKAVWDALMVRLLAIPEYVQLFSSAYPTVPVNELGFQHAANAIAAFEANTWTLVDCPWDIYLMGDDSILSDSAKRGAILFYGKARCSLCHSTNLMTDQEYHNIGVPQLGPGKDEPTALDFGRWHISNDPDDRFAFRTPPLRNVALTGPWMHNGAYTDLEAAVRHHLNPETAIKEFSPEKLSPALQKTCQVDPEIIKSILETLDPLVNVSLDLTEGEISDLMTFIHALTSPSGIDLRDAIPETVPSGLPVRD